MTDDNENSHFCRNLLVLVWHIGSVVGYISEAALCSVQLVGGLAQLVATLIGSTKLLYAGPG